MLDVWCIFHNQPAVTSVHKSRREFSSLTNRDDSRTRFSCCRQNFAREGKFFTPWWEVKIMVSCNDILIHTIFTHSKYHLCTLYGNPKIIHNTNIVANAWHLAVHHRTYFCTFRAFLSLNMRTWRSSQFCSPQSLHVGEEKEETLRLWKNVEQFFADISQLNFGSNRWAYLEIEIYLSRGF